MLNNIYCFRDTFLVSIVNAFKDSRLYLRFFILTNSLFLIPILLFFLVSVLVQQTKLLVFLNTD